MMSSAEFFCVNHFSTEVYVKIPFARFGGYFEFFKFSVFDFRLDRRSAFCGMAERNISVFCRICGQKINVFSVALQKHLAQRRRKNAGGSEKRVCYVCPQPFHIRAFSNVQTALTCRIRHTFGKLGFAGLQQRKIGVVFVKGKELARPAHIVKRYRNRPSCRKAL